MIFSETRGVVGLPEDRGLLAAAGEVAVDAVGRDVEHAVLEPFDRDVGVGEGGVLDPREGRDPVEALGLLAPEGVGVGDRGRVHPGVAVGVDQRVGDGLARGLVQVLVQHGVRLP